MNKSEAKDLEVEDQRRWRLLLVGPNKEAVVLEGLKERKIEGYVPVERVFVGRDHGRRVHERPLVRSYVFTRIVDEQHPIVAHLGWVRGVIGTTARSQINLVNKFIGDLQRDEAAGVYDRTRPPAPLLKEGDAVRIAKGQFKGLSGVIGTLKPNRRAEIVVGLFGGAGTGPMLIDLDKLEAV